MTTPESAAPDHCLFGIRASWVAPVTAGDGDSLIEDGFILVKGSTIVSVGPFIESMTESNVPIVHLEGQLVIPGLINCHTHSGMSLLRGFADDMSLNEWLNDAIWPTEAKFVSPDYVGLGTKLAVYEFLKSGTTTFVDQYFHSNKTAEVCEKIGIRVALGEPIIDFNDGRIYDKINCAFEQASTIGNKYHQDYVIPLINTHACYTIPQDGLLMVGDIARSKPYRINIHLHESQHECDHYADTHGGKTAFQTLIDSNLFDSRLMAAHCVCLSESERQLLATHKVNVVHCPKSNMKLASGICPVQALINAGVNVALGTDSACSNNGLSMLSEMQAAALIGKTVNGTKQANGGDATAVNCHTVLRMATWNGAKALGMDDKIGSIEPGKLADIVAIDLNAIECHPIYNPISTLVYSNGAKVSHVWIGGQRLVSEGIVTAKLDLDLEQVKLIAKDIAAFRNDRIHHKNKKSS